MWQGYTLRLSLSRLFLRLCSRCSAFWWIRPPPREYEGICSFWCLPARGSASAHTAQQRTRADAHAAHMRMLRSTAHAHMRTMPTMRICVWSAQSTHSHIRHVEGALSAHTRIICAYALPRSMCAHARVRILCVRILCPHCNSGGGGSCRRQWKSAAPRGRRGTDSGDTVS